MRTTLTLDDDVAAKLRGEMRRSGRSLKETVNAVLRSGLAARQRVARKPFVVQPRDLGLQPGLSYDSIGTLLESLDGTGHR